MNLTVLYLQFGNNNSKNFDLMRNQLDRMEDISVNYVIVDNKSDSETHEAEEKISENAIKIFGDNVDREFSGWQKGLDYLKKSGKNFDAVLFTNEAFLNLDENMIMSKNFANFVRRSLKNNCVIGSLDSRGVRFELMGYDVSSWICTNAFLVPKNILNDFPPLVSVSSDQMKDFLNETYDEYEKNKEAGYFKKGSKINEDYKTMIVAYLTKMWHSKFEINRETWSRFVAKAQAIFNEALLTAKLREKGICVEDFRSPLSKYIRDFKLAFAVLKRDGPLSFIKRLVSYLKGVRVPLKK